MPKCIHHPGRDSVLSYGNQHYCQPCREGIEAARQQVDRHVEPRDCFVWYQGANRWAPIAGTGCAHWVAHELGITTGVPMERCVLGLTYRVRVLIRGLHAVALEEVQVNDIWANAALDHTGLVIAVTRATRPGTRPAITIRHDSSRQGRVADNDFATYFGGLGSFYRRR